MRYLLFAGLIIPAIMSCDEITSADICDDQKKVTYLGPYEDKGLFAIGSDVIVHFSTPDNVDLAEQSEYLVCVADGEIIDIESLSDP